MPRRGFAFLSGAQQVRFNFKSLPQYRLPQPDSNELSFSPALRHGSVGHPCSAGTLAATDLWRRGPVWRCHFGPFARCR